MADLARVLARMLHDEPDGSRHRPCHLADRALVTPEGKALAALVEAAMAWRDEEPPPKVAWADMTAAADLADAIDAYREATR